MSTKQITTTTIFNYVPNYIGYLRVITAVISFQLMKSHPLYCTLVYCISCLLDALDGHAARYYNQTSRFGAVLDMVTDRCTTSSLICFLCVLYPDYALVFQLLVSLDLASHYMHMYATLQTGGKSHKNIDKESSYLLNLYYTNRYVLFTMCAFNEVFYVALYLYYFPLYNVSIFGEYYSIAGILAAICFPFYLFKQSTNVIQLVRAAVLLAELDIEDLQNKKD
ncbi:CDP-diacylglycerol-inositol 3-phosphatidyltransferase [Wickerhamomyces ciferrii]|uniref:CDP-diacylglycerol--inositol 3-phosphatidyltransferase n=1 Tax=Wickerhamomyces ciferrii (strain ATCC 14091 / BCRC 22168 / CBS 111 / JCM 3599 / NBRC 0793 / NRRL Y-1031 F-60-10) TaxID=1206466 RepID=K0KJT4_WICCF|nr:CDP-diacylglycerol-inositol 3-phosphatidyltransferase [Wickerhamomyces ciferrii]CCH42407.1 CDP-diacylglycerol-inositol 3-phosphatidyltransferase [Wickerhamomyces ciferrii]